MPVVNHFFSRLGVPLELHSDQGRNIESSLFRELCKFLGVRKTRTTPLHPQSDGMVERMNRTLEAQLAKYVEEHHTDWDHYIPLIMLVYHSAVHDIAKSTPVELMLGQNLCVVLWVCLPSPFGCIKKIELQLVLTKH